MDNSMCWRLPTNERIRFKLQVTAMPGFYSLYNWCYQTMSLVSGAPEDPENDTAMEKHCADALNSAVKSLMHAIWTEDHDTQQDAAHRMIQIAIPWMIRWWSESELANRKPVVWILKENELFPDVELTEQEQAQLKTLVERYTSRGASEAWWVHRWRLA